MTNKFYNSLICIMLISSGLYSKNHYKDLTSMLLNIKPFEHEINPGFLSVNYSDEVISSISWFDQDSTQFTKMFHYDDNKDLYLISELRENTILKEFFFNNHSVTERFIHYMFGTSFLSDVSYITEIQYNKDSQPVLYRFKSKSDDYIGHITLNYSNKKLIREVWFQGENKIREFFKKIN